jgi:hypothetical protein
MRLALYVLNLSSSISALRLGFIAAILELIMTAKNQSPLSFSATKFSTAEYGKKASVKRTPIVVTKVALYFIKELVHKSINDVGGYCYALFRHVLVGQHFNPEGVSLSFNFIHQNYGKESMQMLLHKGLLRVSKAADKKAKRSRKYRVATNIFAAFIEKNQPEVSNKSATVDLYTEKPAIMRQRYLDKNNRRYPGLVCEAISSISTCPVNHLAIKLRLKELRNFVSQGRDIKERVSRAASFNSSLASVYLFLHCAKNGQFSAPWYPASSGRIFQSCGLSTLSKSIRAAALEGCPVSNWDIQASQAFIILASMKSLDIQHPGVNWLESYCLGKPSTKADSLYGIPKGIFKILFYSLCFGGTCPANFNQANFSDTGRELLACFPGRSYKDRQDVDNILYSFRAATKDFYEALSVWRSKLLDKVKPISPNGHLHNKMGMKISLHNMSPGEQKRKAAAHLMQGVESYVISKLSTALTIAGHKVYSNAHDGLITSDDVKKSTMDFLIDKIQKEFEWDIFPEFKLQHLKILNKPLDA